MEGVSASNIYKAICASLVSKGVANVDQLKKAVILYDEHGSYIDLEPSGF
jgi:hypothetical protein